MGGCNCIYTYYMLLSWSLSKHAMYNAGRVKNKPSSLINTTISRIVISLHYLSKQKLPTSSFPGDSTGLSFQNIMLIPLWTCYPTINTKSWREGSTQGTDKHTILTVHINNQDTLTCVVIISITVYLLSYTWQHWYYIG